MKERLMKENIDREYFFCYNQNVSSFLKSEGVYFITVAKDLKTGKVFSLYYIDEKLQKALDEYRRNK